MCSCKNIWKHLLEYFVIFECCISHSLAMLPRCVEFHDDNAMHYVCTGLYPRILRIFYADGMVSTGLTYSVFRSISRPHHYLIAHGRSEVSKCRGFLHAYDDHQFRCNERSISLPKGNNPKLFCLNHRLLLAYQLLEHCADGRLPVPWQITMQYTDTNYLHNGVYIPPLDSSPN